MVGLGVIADELSYLHMKAATDDMEPATGLIRPYILMSSTDGSSHGHGPANFLQTLPADAPGVGLRPLQSASQQKIAAVLAGNLYDSRPSVAVKGHAIGAGPLPVANAGQLLTKRLFFRVNPLLFCRTESGAYQKTPSVLSDRGRLETRYHLWFCVRFPAERLNPCTKTGTAAQ